MDKLLPMNKPMLEKIKKAYEQAVAENAESFTVDAFEFVTSYAKYFLEYYAPKFGISASIK